MRREWDEGTVCDVCHQVHRQISPACIERRRQREYAESDEGRRTLREAIAASWPAVKASLDAYIAEEQGVARWHDEDGVSR